jgi:hypothetical protein
VTAVDQLLPIDDAPLRSGPKRSGVTVGLVRNGNVRAVSDGLKRIVTGSLEPPQRQPLRLLFFSGLRLCDLGGEIRPCFFATIRF